MTKSKELWQEITPTFDAILEHPFISGLTDGFLEPDAFAFYLQQDALYLGRYAQALAVLAGRAPTGDDTAMFARHAVGALEVERSLHESLLPELGVDPASLATAKPSPTNLAYTSYLLATGTQHFATTARYEWMFWDMGYRKEAWPV